MKERAVRILSSVLIAVFVNFVFSNTVFLHTHTGLAGRHTTHSHPFHPSSQHGHTAQSFDQISSFNTAATAVEGGCPPVVQAAPACYEEIAMADSDGAPVTLSDAPVGRAPPFAV